MNREQILRDLMALPSRLQQIVADFIAFLRLCYTQDLPEDVGALPPLKDEHFVGIWSDRPDMMDSSTWIRTIRAREWG